MAKLRTFTEDDIPAAAALFARVYPESGWVSRPACEAYFREVFFNNPWRDPELPSWVAENERRIVGFYGVMPRPMLLRERPIRVAVTCQFMVDPDHRHGLVALQLAQACLSGPQDLTLADGASEQTRRGWLAVGGAAPPIYGLHWTRPLRPAQFALSLVEERTVIPRSAALAARPLGVAADVITSQLRPNRFYRESHGLVEHALDQATMLRHLPKILRIYALRPVYDARTLAWLLAQTVRKTCHGRLHARAVRDGERLIGWYLYYLGARGVSEVIQIAALANEFDRVLRRLLADAWRNGATAVHGRLDPRFVQELSNRHCWLRSDGTWTLVHSRHHDVMAAILEGDAFLSRLEGEWWLRFLGEKEALPGAAHHAPPDAEQPVAIAASRARMGG
jgi:hypothetical protein